MDQKTPFTKLLVANRGEIAIRVMRTARAMGYRTVAVHSKADTDAEHVCAADEAVCIGGPAPADSYLRIDRVIEAAKATGADAIHPGYGFLAENPALPRACAEADITFVGPSAHAIEQMGDKAAAKELMEAAGVPCVPGYAGDDQSHEVLATKADNIGYPVMIKATAGGGGRGMRLVEDAGGFNAALTSAKSEAKAAFGDATVLLEKAIINPRHIEIQIMADRHGNVIHLGERDCSVQRRHQKVIEEAPSPAVDAALRAKMGAVSVTAAQAIGYEGAGTFEYLLDDTGAFYFMEMNTRLQVEHPVTEAITGLDLVELQLRIAAGELLALTQDDISFTGHAIEVRLCAEDPGADFMPQSGEMTHWSPPALLRVDHSLRSGALIPPYYDSMVAKVIAHGKTRDDARQRLLIGLQETGALGVRTNLGFLSSCLAHAVFAEGGATTAFIEDHRADLLPDEMDAEDNAAALVGAVLRAGQTTLAHGYGAPLRLRRGEREIILRVSARAHGHCEIVIGEATHQITVTSRSGTAATFTQNGVAGNAALIETNGTLWLHADGRIWDFEDLTLVPEVTAIEGGDGKVRASMNGTVGAVSVAVGDQVTAGQPLVVLEAMKMEHIHAAPVDGTITAVHVETGAQVTAHGLLVEIDPTEG